MAASAVRSRAAPGARLSARRARVARRAAPAAVRAAGAEAARDDSAGLSRRAVLSAPGLVGAAGLVAASPASAAITPTSVTGYDLGIAKAGIGPLGGAVGIKDYAAFEQVIYGFINGIKTGECAPFAKNAVRGFLLKEEGGNRAMLTLLVPEKDQKDGLAFFVNEGPKANPLWAEALGTWRDGSVPITATASKAFLARNPERAFQSAKGLWFGQYQLGWDGKPEDWIPLFVNKDADDFHNSVGVEYSVAHVLDTKSPGNTYKTKGKNAIEVFHCFNSLEGAQELAKVFNPESPFFAGEKRYKGPYSQVIWKIVDDIDFTA